MLHYEPMTKTVDSLDPTLTPLMIYAGDSCYQSKSVVTTEN